DASEREYIDAAWLSRLDVLALEDRSFSARSVSVYFVDMLSKLKIKTPARHALTTSRSQAPVSHLKSYDQPNYGTLVGDSLYLPLPYMTFLPGQIPGLLAGEEIAVYKFNRNDPKFTQSAVLARLPQSRSLLNTSRTTVTATLDPDDLMVMEIGCNIEFKGASKMTFGQLISQADYYAAIENYLGIPADKRYKPKQDAEKVAEMKAKLASAVSETILDMKLRSVGKFDITSIGCTPDSPNTEIAFTAEAENLVSRVGNNLLVDVGKLIGKQMILKESQRTREIEAILPYPSNDRFEMQFSVPAGYVVNDESLEMLNSQIVNNAGTFACRAKVKADDPSVIEISVMLTLRNSVYTPEQWPEVVALIDASATFSGKSLLLNPAK
ncbi:MAG: hypothetical protein K2H98_02280, partial [Duncaniella sp.]|nr:hypothetical protein [Duncaniella sp.]